MHRTPWGVWQALQHTAKSDPSRPAIEEFDQNGQAVCWTYRELLEQTQSIAASLADRVEPGDTLVLDQIGGALQIAWTLAGIRAGAWVLPTPMQTTPSERQELIDRTGPTLLVSPTEPGESVEWFNSRIDKPLAGKTLTERTPGGVVLVTSGTTGRRKLVRRDAASLDADAVAVRAGARLVSSDRVLLALSLSHSYAIDLVMSTISSGATLELVPAFDIAAISKRLASGTTVFPGVPFVFEGLTPRWEGAKHLRLVFSAGAQMPESTRRAFETATGIKIGDLYGSTELGTVIFRHPEDQNTSPGLIGTPLPGVSVRVLDPADPRRILGANEEGELAVRAPSMLREYVDSPNELTDGFFPTGDLARVDAAGRVYLTGRLKFIVEVGGLKLNPIEIERVIESHPGVHECLVSPIRVTDTVSRLLARVVLTDSKSPLSPEQLRAFVRTHVGPSKVPRRFEFVGTLPKTPSGKLIRPTDDEGGH